MVTVTEIGINSLRDGLKNRPMVGWLGEFGIENTFHYYCKLLEIIVEIFI
jgi:hypothetical protein